MKMIFFEWIKSKKLNIDNTKISNADIQKKFVEECAEVIEAYYAFYNSPNGSKLRHLFEEILDLAQMIILMLRRARELSKDNSIDYNDYLERAYEDHKEKCSSRGWEIGESYLNVEVVED